MRPAIFVFLLAGALSAQPSPDSAADRKAIEAVIEKLNFAGERASLFAAGADIPAELLRLERASCRPPGTPKVWSEIPSPRFSRPTVQFLAPDIALADLDYVQFASVTAGFRSPIVVVLKRENREWKIATLRTLPDCPGALRILPAGQ